MFFQAWASRRNQPNAIGSIFARSDIDSDFKAAFRCRTLHLQVWTVRRSGIAGQLCSDHPKAWFERNQVIGLPTLLLSVPTTSNTAAIGLIAFVELAPRNERSRRATPLNWHQRGRFHTTGITYIPPRNARSSRMGPHIRPNEHQRK